VIVEVALGGRSYDVLIGPGVRHQLEAVLSERCVEYQTCVAITSASLRTQPWFDFFHFKACTCSKSRGRKCQDLRDPRVGVRTAGVA